ncbi:hypothetical protein AK812_SmicGene12661 [Symbiodinium microadriaticum]|uniref:Uncharacterized protein n=1 Tax=Symbiodinium microadriaticum TaxID=2951 RepID=A0A1Q9EA17_SYMMI|nr:hypothetical protein AK812_SmicGene12661 [Symbiodinium microadriaticum]
MNHVFRTADVLALIATALVPCSDQSEVSTFVSGANYATTASVTSAISSALSSYDDSSQVDSKVIAALLDFYMRAETDQLAGPAGHRPGERPRGGANSGPDR